MASAATLCAAEDPPAAPPTDQVPAELRLDLDPALRLERPFVSRPDDSGGVDDPLGTTPAARPLIEVVPLRFDLLLGLADWDAEGIAATDLALVDFAAPPPSSGARGPLTLGFRRDTRLVDGGFGTTPQVDETAASLYESPGERFDRYGLSLEWAAAGADRPVQWLLLGGLQAIRADIRRLDPASASLELAEARGMVTVPTVGTGVRWSPTDHIDLSTVASMQTGLGDADLVDIIASAAIRFSPFVDLSAGYQFLRSEMEVEDLDTRLNREGVFAKLTIRF